MIRKCYIVGLILLATVLMMAVVVGRSPLHLTLQNPGFEKGLVSWLGAERFKDDVAIVSGRGRTGERFLRISMKETSTTLPSVHQRVLNLEPGATYRFSAWVRGAKGGGETAVKLKLDFYNAKGENTSIHPAVMPVAEGKGWRLLSVTSVTEADTVLVDTVVSLTGAGVADIDDVHFEKVAERPELRVSSAKPLAVDPDCRTTLDFNASFGKPYRGEGLPSFEVKVDGAAVTESPKVRRIDGRNFVLTTTLPPLSPGARQITFSCGSQEAAEAVKIDVVPRARKPAFLGDSGEHRRGDKVFFPIGIYNVEHHEAEYATLAAHGFNMIQGKFPGDLDDFVKSLDLALRYGIAVDVPLYAGGKAEANIPRSLEVIRRAGRHPAVLCWKIYDEPDADQNVAVRAELPRVYAALKAENPLQPLELTLCQEKTFEYWTRLCDNVQVDHYPLPGGSIAEVYNMCVKAKETMKPWQNLTFVLQCGWTSDLKTQPTAAQARAMVYLALIGGARGISWYSMREANWDLTKTPLWPRLAVINMEISALAKPLLLGKEVTVRSDNAEARVSGRMLEGRLYLLICNPGRERVELALTLPPAFANAQWTTARAMDAPSRQWAVEKGSIRCSLEPLESFTMLLDLKNESSLRETEGTGQ